MPCPTSTPEPLRIPSLAMELLHDLNPKTPREILLARQAAWAAAHLLNLIGDSPAEPDAKWLRLHNSADRILHRNLRLLDRLRAQRPPAPAPTVPTPNRAPTIPAPTPSTPARAASAAPSTSPFLPPPRPSRPTPSPAHRADLPGRTRMNLDLSCSSPRPLPIFAAPSPASG